MPTGIGGAGRYGSHGVLISLLLVGLSVFALLTVSIEANDLVGGDEGYYGVMARNALHGIRHLLNPSLSPLGPPGDKPFAYPAVLSLGLRVGGVREASLRVPTLFFAVACGFLLYGIGRALGAPDVGGWAALFWLVSPLVGHAGRLVQAETPLTALALAGAWCFLLAIRRESNLGAVASGVLFGLAFLTKLWLVFPILAGAVAGGVLLKPTPQRGHSRSKRLHVRFLSLFVAAFTLTASTQIILCALLTPETAGHWVRIYFGFSLAGRLQESGHASYWIHPWSYYLQVIGKSIALWIPLVVLGLAVLAAATEAPAGRRAWRGLVFFWILPLVPMSLAPVKSGNYVLPLLPAFALLAGLGFRFLRRFSTGFHPGRPILAAAAVLSVGALAVQAAGRAEGGSVSSMVPLVLQAAWAGAFLWLAARRRPSRVGRLAVALCVVLMAAAGLARDAQLVRARPHLTAYREAAQVLRPGLARIDPRQPCFFAPEWPSMSFYTFRTGRYWESPYVPASPDSVRRAIAGDEPFFFLDVPSGLYGGRPDSASAAALRATGEEVLRRPHLVVYGNDALGRALQLSRRVSREGS